MPHSTAPTRPCVFLDRDGTLIEERHYLHDPGHVHLLPGTVSGLRLLVDHGHPLVVVTNQAGIGRSLYTEHQMHACNQRMVELLAAAHIALDGLYFCPHIPSDNCKCRKPAIGMALQASRDLGVTLSGAWVIGDKALDVNLALGIGGHGILVRTGYGQDPVQQSLCAPEAICNDLYDAASWIIAHEPRP